MDVDSELLEGTAVQARDAAELLQRRQPVKIGVIPALGAGLQTMAATGQAARLLRHLAWYRELGDVSFFSYLEESGPDLLVPCRKPAWPARRYALCLPFLEPEIRRADVLRCLNLLGAVPAIVARLAFGVPFIFSYGADYKAIARLHGRSHQHLIKWTWLERVAFRWAAAVLVSNPMLAARLQARYPRAKIISHGNWVDTRLFCPDGNSAPAGQNPGPILYVGRLVKEKNLLPLATIAWVTPRWTVRLVGEGPLAEGFRRLRCQVPGPIPWERLPEEYRAAGVFCLPSLTEGNPKALLEAMACGTPVAVSDRVEGVIRHGETGLVFVAEDQRSLLDALRRVLSDRKLARTLGSAAREWVGAHHNVDVLMPRELEIIRAAAFKK